MINICLFGAGRIARVHAANVAAHPALTLRTVVDIDLNKSADPGRAVRRPCWR